MADVNNGTFEGEFPSHWLSRYPLAGDVKSARPWSARMPRAAALSKPYIEANPLALRSLLVTDHDGGEAEHIASVKGLPEPSYVALNAFTGSGHIVYALAAPVCMTDAGRVAPIRLLSRIESGLTSVLGGDLSYGSSSGTNLTKNPLHAAHTTVWGGSGAAYEMRDLARALDDLGALPRLNDSESIKHSMVGRNCALFDLTRHWAYRAILRHYGEGQDAWETLVTAYAWDRNLAQIGAEFSRGPLDAAECATIARSVARWTWRKFWQNGGMEGFKAKQIERAKRSHQTGKRTVTDRLRAANKAHGFQPTAGMNDAREELGA